MSLIIGLTGENCSGKGISAEYLKKRGFYYLSLSDFIREELAEDNAEITRESMIAKGNDLRARFGPSILAQRAVHRMEKDRNYIIDSIRNPGEVKELKKLRNFVLVHVHAPPEIRFERMRARKRESDPQSFEAFKIIEEAEMKKEGQNLGETIKMADRKIENSAEAQDLYDKWDALLSQLSKDFHSDRPTWDEYFMSIAKQVASRSNCIKRKVAAVIVRDKRIISTGYNGTPRGTKNCNEGGCPRCNSFAESGTKLEECYCAHGEENAIVQAAYHGISVKDSTIYTTFCPCLYCTRMIINAGIKEVVYNADYPLHESALKLLEEAGVIIRKMKI